MLHELESGVEWLLKQDSSSQSQSALLHTWDTRSKLIQVMYHAFCSHYSYNITVLVYISIGVISDAGTYS